MEPGQHFTMMLDANIIIAYLAGEEHIITTLSTWRRNSIALLLPTVVETEILSFSKWTPEERRSTELFLEENFTSLPFDRTIARIAAQLRADTKIKFPDAAIAASALYTRTPLVTRNVKDFKHIKDLRILRL